MEIFPAVLWKKTALHHSAGSASSWVLDSAIPGRLLPFLPYLSVGVVMEAWWWWWVEGAEVPFGALRQAELDWTGSGRPLPSQQQVGWRHYPIHALPAANTSLSLTSVRRLG